MLLFRTEGLTLSLNNKEVTANLFVLVLRNHLCNSLHRYLKSAEANEWVLLSLSSVTVFLRASWIHLMRPHLLVLQIQFKFYNVVVDLKRYFSFLPMVISFGLNLRIILLVARLWQQDEQLDQFPWNEHSLRDTEMQSGFWFLHFRQIFQKLYIFSVNEVFLTPYMPLVVHCLSSAGDLFLTVLW